MYKQKDIVLLPFPYSDLTGAKQRPAVIISNEKLNKTQDRICCLITSNILTTDGLPLSASALTEGTLPFKSLVKPQRLFTVHEKIIKKKLATITDSFHEQIVAEVHKYIQTQQSF